jgi:hypothetical protein
MLKKPNDGVAIRGFILGAGAATNNAKIREICDLLNPTKNGQEINNEHKDNLFTG